MNNLTDHKKLSYTAAPVVYGRTFSDIPYSKEIADICDVEHVINDAYRETNRLIAPYIEARFKALSNVILKSGITNIVEVASGLSQRGLIMTENPAITYIETDLPDMIQEKKEIMEKLIEKVNGNKSSNVPSNLFFKELNVLDEDSFRKVIGFLPPGPVAIGHEGLLAHLTRDERTKMALIIKNILVERGGIWVTPDVFTRAQLAELLSGKKQNVTEDVVKNTGRNYNDNAFTDIDDAKSFFTDLGFKYVIRTLGETAGELASVNMSLDKESIENQVALNIWELRSNKNNI